MNNFYTSISIVFLLFSCLVVSLPLQAQWDQIGADLEGDMTYEYFGRAMDLSPDGTTVAIGSQANPENIFTSFVRIYKKDANTWHPVGNDIGASNGDNSDDIALSADGSRVAIGSLRDGVVNGSANYDGHIRIFDFIDNDWQQVGDDIMGSGGENLGFAISLSANGKILATGSHFNDENGDDAGQVRVYKETNGTWQQIGDLINGDAEFDNFGLSIDISADGSVIAIGAPFNNNNTGQVKAYRYVNDNWQQIGNDILGAPADVFGHSVSLNKDGSILAIGAIQQIASSTGYVSVYQNIDGAWQQVGNNIPGEHTNSLFGISVSLNDNGDVLATGGSFVDGNGKMRIYQNNSNTWLQIGQDINGVAGDDSFGQIACLSKDGSIVAGAGFLNDGNGYQAGHVRVFENKNLVGFNDLQETNISVYPNPSNGLFFIENAENFKVTITDIRGQLLFNTILNTQTATIDVSHQLLSGIYFIQLQSATQHYVVKYVVE